MDELLLAAQLHDLAVRVGVLREHEGGARRRPVLGHQAAGLVADSAGIAKRLGAQGARAPLRRLLGGAVGAPPRRLRLAASVAVPNNCGWELILGPRALGLLAAHHGRQRRRLLSGDDGLRRVIAGVVGVVDEIGEPLQLRGFLTLHLCMLN
jgi:hypothetical protein